MTTRRKKAARSRARKPPRAGASRRSAPRRSASRHDAEAEASVQLASRLPFPVHGALQLPAVELVSYNLELRARGKFLGDIASSTAFAERIEEWRAVAREGGKDPFGRVATDDLSRKDLARIMHGGDADAAGIVQSALDDFARSFVEVIRQFRHHGWKRVEEIVVGGGFRQSRLGELAMGRAQALLRHQEIPVELKLIGDHPDEAGLLGVVHLVPSWMLHGFDGMLAVDIGGSNIRSGIVGFRANGKRLVRDVAVLHAEQWRHRADKAGKQDIIEELIGMLKKSIARARNKGIKLAPIVGVGCPGRIAIDGAIMRGVQNLPGGWDNPRFHLPRLIADRLGDIRGQRPSVIMHNDAVVQGLSALSMMRRVPHWGILTIGTGLGNAAFARRSED